MKLDADQEQVVNHGDGHALVLAGAGSGKTACVTVRAATRIASGIDPARMLLLTFTNKACREMKERLTGILPSSVALPTVSTFHAFGHRLLRKYPEFCHRRPKASMMDPDDASRLLGLVITDHGIPKSSVKTALQVFAMMRNNGLNPGTTSDKNAIMRMFEDTGVFSYEECDRMVAVGRDYEKRKQDQNLVDFDDLIALPTQALLENPDLRVRITRHLLDVTVDESQDNNKAQYKLLKLIAGKTVVMVGDDDQSIHRWRGAHPEGLEQFKREFAPQIFRLERNYRSLPVIVNSATRMIRHNEERLEKNPYPTRPEDHRPIPYLVHATGDRMAERIAEEIGKSIRNGSRPSEIAILYRTNAMAKALEPSLLRRNIPYRIKAGTDLMSYAEIKMLMAAARLAVNPQDAQAFARLSTLLPGLGTKSIDKMVAAAGNGGILEAAHAAPKKLLEDLVRLKTSLDNLYDYGPEKLIAWAIGPGGFKPWLKSEAEKAVKAKDKGLTGFQLKEAINENLTRRVCRLKLIGETISARLAGIDTETPIDDRWAEALEMLIQPPDEDPESGAVTLSTVHGSKGLQWDTVHIAGFSEGLMPFEKDGKIQNLTEERCLAYVGWTRAENNLYLHHAQTLDLKMGGGAKQLQTSRFIKESLEAADSKVIQVVYLDRQKKTRSGLRGLLMRG